jgi:pSer/pThr/pTyr-binding forkhead associated (FHA) protein
MSRALLLLLAGALGGLIAWMITEPLVPRAFADEVAWKKFGGFFGPVTGLCIGALVGAVSGWIQGTRLHLLRGLGFGALIGAVGGALGLQIGNQIFAALGGNLSPLVLVARTLGWAAFGALIGLAEGAVGRSSRRALQGAVGGLLGGAVGGFGFEIAAQVLGPISASVAGGNEVGQIPRMVGLVSIGAGIGLLIGIVEALTRQAWVRVLLGRNEGKDYPLDAVQSWIGRSETAHVPIFGDANVAPAHASIVRQGGQYVLYDNGSPIGTGLNGHRIQQALLQPGDIIQVASFNLQFMTKGAKPVRTAAPQRFEAMPVPQVPPSAAVGPSGSATVAFASAPAAGMTMAAPAAMLQAITGPLAGQRFPVQGTLEVGREVAGLALSFDTMASRRHASFALDAGGLTLTDLGSTNGTLVNGQKVSKASLKIGDIIQIGTTQFRVETAP